MSSRSTGGWPGLADVQLHPGELVVRRDRCLGRTVWAVATIVVDDRPDCFVTYSPPGSESMVVSSTDVIAEVATGRWELVRTERYNHTLAIHEPGEAFSVLVFFDDA